MGAKCGKTCQPCKADSERLTFMDLSVGPERQTMSTMASVRSTTWVRESEPMSPAAELAEEIEANESESVESHESEPLESRKSEPLVQTVEWGKESIDFEPTFDPIKAEQLYTEKRVALNSEKAELEKFKAALQEEAAQIVSKLKEKTAEFEKEQEQKTQEMLAKQLNLANKEQQCRFRWAKLSKMLQQVEVEEARKRAQREAGTKRLSALKKKLEAAVDRVNATDVLDKNVADLDAAYERRVIARAKLNAKKNKRISWGKRKCRLRAKTKKTIDNKLKRKVKPSQLSRKKDVQSIYTAERDFEPTASKCNLVFDSNRNVLTKQQALKKVISKQKNEHKVLDRELAMLASEKRRLESCLGNAEGCSPVLVKRLDRQIDSLNKKYQTLSAKRYEVQSLKL